MTGSAGPLVNGAGRLGVTLDHGQVVEVERLVTELLRWNKAYNLTSITDPDLILTPHLLDSLSVHPELVALVGDEPVHLGEGALVQERLEALAGGLLAGLVLTLDALAPAGQIGGLVPAAKLREALIEGHASRLLARAVGARVLRWESGQASIGRWFRESQ